MLTLEDVFLKVTMGEWATEQKKSASTAASEKTAEAVQTENTEEEAK